MPRKSTMLDALCFALFNKPFRKVSKPQLINSINARDLIVELYFDTNNKSYKQLQVQNQICLRYIVTELVNQDANVRDYQEYLEKFILKLNYKSFTQIVILNPASFTPFMQLSQMIVNHRRVIRDSCILYDEWLIKVKDDRKQR